MTKYHHGLAVAACGWNFPSLLPTISLDNCEKCLCAYTIYSFVMTPPARRLAQTHSPNSSGGAPLKLTSFKDSL